MSRVLLVCPEPLGHGQPAGIGIRFVEIARVLLADRHHVTILSPDGGTIEGCDAAGLDRMGPMSATHDVAVVQGHVANAFFASAKATIPTVVDLYDPFIIENLHYYAERGAEVFQHDHFTLINSITSADYFLCASEAQRLFYIGVLLAAGRVNPTLFEEDPRLESLIGVAPFGVQPAHAVQPRASHDILFGGIYDWYDPIAAIHAVAIVRATAFADATLTFTHHPNPELTPQGKLAEAMDYARRNAHDFVRFEPWAAYDQRAEFFERFAIALLTFPRSIETDLSMRTRVYDYLWCGLPIVTSSAPGTDEILTRYGAGIVTDDFVSAIVRLFTERETYASMLHGSQEFVRDHQWDRTLAPLRNFCRAPRVEKTKELFAIRPPIAERPASILDRLKRRLRA
jgi:hypothetical protein